MDGEYLVVRSRGAWIQQMEDALNAWEASGAATVDAFADADYPQFCLLVEAWYALSVEVADELLARAQMRPVSEALGLND